MGAGVIHKALVEEVAREQGAQVGGWRSRDLAKIVDPQGTGFCFPPMFPDAWKLDKSARLIILFEVEYGHPLDEKALRKYATVWFYLDCLEWDLGLVVVNRDGDMRQVSLMKWWYRFAIHDAANPLAAKDSR